MGFGVGSSEASLIVEEGAEFIVALDGAEGIVLVHLKCLFHGLSVASHATVI